MTETKKTYRPVRGGPQPETLVVEWERCSAMRCDICRSAREYLKIAGEPERIRNLARGSLGRHLATGKHWEKIRQYYVS